MKTYWQSDVRTYQNGRMGTSTLMSKDGLDAALAQGVTDASFYVLCSGYSQVTIEVTETCSRCNNEGRITVRRPRSTKTLLCPECRGKMPTGHIGPFPFTLHENVRQDLALANAD